jgi:hypothetical protein
LQFIGRKRPPAMPYTWVSARADDDNADESFHQAECCQFCTINAIHMHEKCGTWILIKGPLNEGVEIRQQRKCKNFVSNI